MNPLVFIFCTNTDWFKEPPRCRHQLARQFAKLGKVIFIQRPTQEDADKDGPIHVKTSPKTIFPKKMTLLLPPLKNHENKVFNTFLKGIIHNEGKVNPDSKIVILNFRYDLVIDSDINCDVHYICNDEFTDRHPWPVSSLLESYEKKAIERSKAAFAISRTLQAKISQVSSRTYRFNPGIEVITDFVRPKAEKGTSRKIRIGHGGFLNNRIDYSVIEKLAVNQNFEIELFGVIEGAAANERIEKLRSLGVKVSGPKVGKEYLEYLSGFDGLVMPYVLNKGTLAISIPNKLLQYLQTGCPVFISHLPNLESDLFPHINAMKGIDWGDQIIRAIAEDRDDRQRARINFSNSYTWENTAKTMWENMQK